MNKYSGINNNNKIKTTESNFNCELVNILLWIALTICDITLSKKSCFDQGDLL